MQVQAFPAYLRGIETSGAEYVAGDFPNSFQPTYEGLKRERLEKLEKQADGFQPTYEGLKPGLS